MASARGHRRQSCAPSLERAEGLDTVALYVQEPSPEKPPIHVVIHKVNLRLVSHVQYPHMVSILGSGIVMFCLPAPFYPAAPRQRGSTAKFLTVDVAASCGPRHFEILDLPVGRRARGQTAAPESEPVV